MHIFCILYIKNIAKKYCMSDDIVADALTNIRNAVRVGKKHVSVKYSKLVLRILNIFKEKGFIMDFEFVDDNKKEDGIMVNLNYDFGQSVRSLEKISKLGVRKYCGYKDIPVAYSGLGTVVMSTSKGVMTGEEAKKAKVGGEIICIAF